MTESKHTPYDCLLAKCKRLEGDNAKLTLKLEVLGEFDYVQHNNHLVSECKKIADKFNKGLIAASYLRGEGRKLRASNEKLFALNAELVEALEGIDSFIRGHIEDTNTDHAGIDRYPGTPTTLNKVSEMCQSVLSKSKEVSDE